MGTIERVTVSRTVSGDWEESGEFRDVEDACEVAKALARSGAYTKISVVLHTRQDVRKGAAQDWVNRGDLAIE